MTAILTHVAGCLLGGAVGDALGVCVGAVPPDERSAHFGPHGIADYVPTYGRVGGIGWHTQLAMVTAEGMLRAHNRSLDRGFCHLPGVVYSAYRRWLAAQGEELLEPEGEIEHPASWLLRAPAVADRRGVSAATVAALRSGEMGAPGRPINDSMGCGAITRVAPIGLTSIEDPFMTAAQVAALTHGHPAAQDAAGFVAVLVGILARQQPLGFALATAHDALRRPDADPTVFNLVLDVKLRKPEDLAGRVRRGAFGSGRAADEALAIALACVRCAADFEHGVRLAVNHYGATDATGALTGQILGALFGVDAIPKRWLEPLEVQSALLELASDLDRHFGSNGGRHWARADWEKYPGW